MCVKIWVVIRTGGYTSHTYTCDIFHKIEIQLIACWAIADSHKLEQNTLKFTMTNDGFQLLTLQKVYSFA